MPSNLVFDLDHRMRGGQEGRQVGGVQIKLSDFSEPTPIVQRLKGYLNCFSIYRKSRIYQHEKIEQREI